MNCIIICIWTVCIQTWQTHIHSITDISQCMRDIIAKVKVPGSHPDLSSGQITVFIYSWPVSRINSGHYIISFHLPNIAWPKWVHTRTNGQSRATPFWLEIGMRGLASGLVARSCLNPTLHLTSSLTDQSWVWRYEVMARNIPAMADGST